MERARMKLRLSVQTASKAVKPNKMNPIFETMLLEPHEGGTMITGTDGRIAVKIKVDSWINEPIAVPAKLLQALIADEMTLYVVEGSRLQLKSQDGSATIAGHNHRLFPDLQIEPGEPTHCPLVLAKGFERCIRSTECSGMDFDKIVCYKGGTCVSTDTIRLAVVGDTQADEKDFAISSSAARILLPHLVEGATVSHTGDRLVVNNGDVTFCSELVSAEFPDFRKILPTAKEQVSIDRQVLLGAISRCMPVARENRNKIEIDAGSISARSHVGSVSVAVPDLVPGERCGLNGLMLSRLLSAMAADVVTLGFSGSVSPITISDSDGVSLLMPLNM